MKMRSKGKVHPSSTPLPLPFPAEEKYSLSVLNLLPAAILLLLSVQDRQVLAYMITRSITSTNPSPSPSLNKKSNSHKSLLFYCDCFDCYTTYWFKWDSSPNRHLIHQAIEAFEDRLTNREQYKKKGKKRDRKIYSHPPENLQVVEEKTQDGVLIDIAAEEMADAQPPEAVSQQHKGLARKVLPNVMGLFNWRLWSPNVSF